MTARFPQELLCANDNPPPPVGTPVSHRLSDQLAPTRQHQPTHAPLLSNRSEPFNHSRRFTMQRATKVAAIGFPVAVGRSRTIELTRRLFECISLQFTPDLR